MSASANSQQLGRCTCASTHTYNCALARACAGCDPSLYERVVDLRERRLDEEDAAAEVNKSLETIKKERELLSKKAKVIEQSLAAINQVG